MRILYALLLPQLLFFQGFSQDTTRVLFVGNSFTYFNNMPQMVQAFADSAKIRMEHVMHAPPGISVGDLVDGSQAHMNNPALYAIIRSKKWDVMVLQDKQGRFMRDSAQFLPVTTSRIFEGHIKLMDSLKASNSCAKVVLFGGWVYKNGSPPFGNTGIEMIQRVMVNYRVLNDSMNEVIAPIGEAWIKGINYLPAVDLWDPDQSHPSNAGSYLTASVIFSTIFNFPAKNLNHTAGIAPIQAATLRAFGDTAVFDAGFHVKYNLGGMKKISPVLSNSVFSIPGTYAGYTWYRDGLPVSSSATLDPQNLGTGAYSAFVKENDSCRVKTCSYYYEQVSTATGVRKNNSEDELWIYPNPSTRGSIIIKNSAVLKCTSVGLFNIAGFNTGTTIEEIGGEVHVSTAGLEAGCYFLRFTTDKGTFHKTVLIQE